MYALKISDGEQMVVMKGYDEVERVVYSEARYRELNGNRGPIPVEIAQFLKIKHPEDPWPEMTTEYVFMPSEWNNSNVHCYKKPHSQYDDTLKCIESIDEVATFCDRHFRMHPKICTPRALDIFAYISWSYKDNEERINFLWKDLVNKGDSWSISLCQIVRNGLKFSTSVEHPLPIHELVEALNAKQEYPDCIDYSDLLHLELLPFVCNTTSRRMTKQEVFAAAAWMGYCLHPPYIGRAEYILREVPFLTPKTLEVYNKILWDQARPRLLAAYGDPDKWNKLRFHNNALHIE